MISKKSPTLDELCQRMALISGTSSCHMAVSKLSLFVPGVWGPFFSAMIPGLWLNEGGQSTTGKLLDHIVSSHSYSTELKNLSAQTKKGIYQILNENLYNMAKTLKVHVGQLTKVCKYPL